MSRPLLGDHADPRATCCERCGIPEGEAVDGGRVRLDGNAHCRWCRYEKRERARVRRQIRTIRLRMGARPNSALDALEDWMDEQDARDKRGRRV